MEDIKPIEPLAVHPENVEYVRQLLDEYCEQMNMKRMVDKMVAESNAKRK